MKHTLALLTLLFSLATSRAAEKLPANASPPNVIYLMVDELGYYEPGFAGGETIQTPNMDRFAAEGIRFTNMLAGSCVCAPTRCSFITGKHIGHTSVRANLGGTPLRAEEITIASMLKPLGYATGGFGKWGVGNTRRLITNSDVKGSSKRAHSVVVPGGKDVVGQWLYDDVLRYLFTHPVDQSGPATPMDADFEMDQRPKL
jgi:arylsulfatase A-like enzyme